MDKRLKKIVENAKKTSPYLETFHHSWIDGNGYEVACDAHRIVRLYKTEQTEDLKYDNTYDIEQHYKGFEELENEAIEVTIPNDLKENINNLIGKCYKTKKVKYRLGDNTDYPSVNAVYLMELSEILKTNKIYFKKKNCPLLMKSEIGDALLLPMCDRMSNGERYQKI